ncbi:hypothetical protein [Streptomyces vinaceus]|uniref:hypothetical protein n=1 Tax=Streptomyces vinaceus TaxID=1960 RepID=UPI0036CD1CD6
MPLTRTWTEISPEQAAAEKLNLVRDLHITAPRNEMGERCPWPWEPQQLVGAPIGQYHCPHCGAMVLAGVPHIDYAGKERLVTPDSIIEILEWCGPSKLRYADVNGRLDVVGLTILGLDGGRTPALFGDTVVRDDDGAYSVRKAAS